MLFTVAYFTCAWIAAQSLTRISNCSSTGAERALTATVWFVVSYLLPVHLAGIAGLVGLPEPIRESLLLPLIGVAAVSLFWLTRKRAFDGYAVPQPLVSKLPAVLKLSILTLSGAYAIGVANMLSEYPTGFDAEYYRWPLALRWFQEKSLQIGPGAAWHTALPGNGEIGALLIFPSGVDRLLPVAQWPGTLALGLAMYLLVMRFVGSRTTAVSAVLITLSLPIVYFQTFSGYVDLFGTSMLVAAAALALLASDRVDASPAGARRMLLAAAWAAGIAVGTKPIFWPYAALWAAGAVLVFRRRMNAAALMAVLVGGLLLPSGF